MRFLTALLLCLGLLTSVVSAQDKNLEKVMAAIPEKAQAAPKQPRKLLIFSKTAGFRHGSIGIGGKALTIMGDKTGAYTAVHTEDESYFEPEKLKVFDAVFMLNTTGECFKPRVEKGDAEGAKKAKEREEMLKLSLVEFVKGGKGLAGCHSSTDTYHNWKEYNQMIGGTFAGHPWHQKIPVKNLAPSHPLNIAFNGKDFEINDEIYQFRKDTAQPTERKFILAMDTAAMNEKDVKKGGRADGLYPISWLSTHGKGRTFYCSLGHRDEIYWNPQVLKHYLAGIQFVFGDLEADAAPAAATSGKK